MTGNGPDWATQPNTFSPDLELANSQAEEVRLRSSLSAEKKRADKNRKDLIKSRKEVRSLRGILVKLVMHPI